MVPDFNNAPGFPEYANATFPEVYYRLFSLGLRATLKFPS